LDQSAEVVLMTEKRMNVSTLIFLVVLAVLGPDRARAQSAPNLSGEWKLNIALSDFGSIPPPQMMSRSIQHNDPSLRISTHQKAAQEESTTELVYTTDGRECVNKIRDSEARGTAKWQGGHLVIESIRNLQGTDIKSVETWTLSDGGEMLTIANRGAVQQQVYNIKLVFDKQ
jgi:hypothetical protein